MDSWSDMLQDAAGLWAKSAIDYRYNQQYQLQKMAMQQYGPNGAPYMEGQPTVQASNGAVSASIPQSWLVIGAIIAAVVLMGD